MGAHLFRRMSGCETIIGYHLYFTGRDLDCCRIASGEALCRLSKRLATVESSAKDRAE
jgi:hypothetical protein